MPTPRLFIAVPTLALCLVMAACGKENAQAQGRGAADRPIPVTTAVVRPQPWRDTIQALGTVKARESITLTAKVSETVERVHFDSGDEVRAGAPLITLTGQQQEAAFRAAQATADEAERLYRRQSELAAQQLIARASLDTQRATRDAAQAEVAQIRANLNDRVIRAPFGGVVGIRQISPGSLVTPGTAIATLDDISRVYIDFPVPEAQLAHLAVGQQLTGTSVAYAGRKFDGAVSTIDARVDPATRAVMVRGDFANASHELRPGMLLEVRLERPERPALVAPEIAVVQIGRDSFLYRVKTDGSVERVGVELGARDAGRVEIVKGVKAGDRIVVEGTGKLRPGVKIADSAQSRQPPAQAPAGQG